MSKRIFASIAFFVFALFATGSFAQENRTLDTKVADVLAQMPTNDLVHRDRLMNELIALGPEGFREIATMLTPPGTGDDTAVRFALNSLARYVSEFGKEEERDFIETALLEALDNRFHTEVKTFLMNQLNLVAGGKTVDALAGYLAEGPLTEPATQTLLAVGSKDAAQALLGALPAADKKTRVTLVRALGQLRCRSALEAITPLAGSKDPGLRKVALEALAAIGDPGSYKRLLKAAKSVDFAYEPTRSAASFLTYARRLAENGETRLAQKALKKILKANKEQGKWHHAAGALAIYARHFGYEAMPLLLKAVEEENKAFRYAVLNIGGDIGGVAGTRQWMEKAEGVPAGTKAEIIDMLGRRGDPLAVDFVAQNLESASLLVRQEAINALVQLKGKQATDLLIGHLAAGNDVEATQKALMQLLDQKHLGPVAAKLDETEGTVKAAFIDLIAAKAGTQYFNKVLAITGSENEAEKTAAFRALKHVSSGENLPDLIRLLLSAAGETEIEQVQMAVVAAARNIEAERTEEGLLLQALETTSQKARIISILPKIGGDVALEKVTHYFSNGSGDLKEAAFEALVSWNDYSAARSLYKICRSASGEFKTRAFSSFVRQVRSANIPDDQKLLQYRKIMPHASGADDQKQVIEATGNLNTFLSLVYLEQFLNREPLQQTAARAIMKIALPNSNGEHGFTGRKVRNLLEKVASVIQGEDSQYHIINIKDYLEEMPEEEGFVSMFNGKNLEGWQGLVGNPVTRAEMTEAELADKQKEANKVMHENWSVKDNTIVFSGKGANICSVKEYGDFELIVDWRITKNGDSGIYLRGTPQVQVWDTSRVEVGAQVGSGGLYNNQKHESKPLKVADNPVGEWNTFHITMIGENVTVYLNGELVVDNVPLENYWDRSRPIFDKGPIELQAHGTNLAFRDIYVREINTAEIGLTREEISEGFVSLFNGRNLDGWRGNKTDYVARDGELLVRPERGGHGNLYTAEQYSDFIFRFEFQLTPGANNGLGIRAPLEGDAAYVGMELQILDNTAPIYANLKPYQYHGSVYGVIPAKRGFLNPVGEWNSQEVIVKGSKVKVILNGEVILDGDIAAASEDGTADGRNHPGLKREKGYIGFLGHGSELKFRNIRVKAF